MAIDLGSRVGPYEVTALLGEGGMARSGGDRSVYVSPDGQRILVTTAEDQASAPITVVVNWQSALGSRGGR